MRQFLSEADIEQIDETGRRILTTVGIRILDKQMLDRLRASGAQVEPADGRARLPDGWIDRQLASAPDRFTLFSRDGQNDLDLGSGQVYFGNGGRAFQILDLATGGFRPTMLRDVANTAALVEQLSHIRFYIIACQAYDLAPDAYHLNDFFHALLHTNKHVMGGVDNLEGARQMVELAEDVAGGNAPLRQRPFVSVMTNPISPLTVDGESIKILEFLTSRGIPVTFAPAPISGATAPATLAGTLAQLHAEALAGAALVQFMSPGTPVMYGSVPMTMDLRTMDLAVGSVETAMLNTCCVALAHRYRLPIYASAGLTDAKQPDIQAGFEKGVSNLLLGRAGADFVHLAAGMLDSGNSISYEQYVIDDEIIGMVERLLRGVTINAETLALECIERVGPGGNYVTEEHTVEHMFSEFFYPKLAVREQYDRWVGRGAPTPLIRAQSVVDEILDEHAHRLDPAAVKGLRSRFPRIVDV
ncbi:MAG: trimethylamine methyltransferase family protein [Desulfobacterales bacterium]|nr:trimethylamine methyltransferase family protein [Desulfobacterales bacterium]MCF8079721.1 trimethylamine methyltransferase family protein [Desulfobacterales bacterium]